MLAFSFLLTALAVYRIGRMISIEEGPAGVFNSVRRKLPSTWLANKEVGTLCVMCVTFWLSLPASPAWLIMAGGLPSSELAIYALWIMTGWAGLAGLATIMYRLTG